MSIGNLKTEGDLARFVDDRVQTPGVVPQQPTGGVALAKEGVPEDGDFPGTPSDGILALDTAAKTLYARISGEWVAL